MPDHNDNANAAVDGGKVIDLSAGRRAFLRSFGVAIAGAGALAAGAGVTLAPSPAQAQDLTDVDIGNFALNLEYLEAEFYLRAVSGQGLPVKDTDGTGRPGKVIGGAEVPFTTKAIRQYAQEIADDEYKHVLLLRSVLGDGAVARPAINLNTPFTDAARAAGLVGPNERFDAFANETNFLLAAFIFEDVGVTAYRGAAPLITDKGILSAAAGLLGAEAYHAGLVRTLLYQGGFLAQTAAISDLRDSVDRRSDLDQGVGGRNGRANIVPTDSTGLVFARSTEQVLAIVYLGGKGRGGFFPQGVNA